MRDAGLSRACISEGTLYRVCLTSVGGSWFGFDSKHQCFKTAAGDYSEPLERMPRWGDVGG